MIGVYATPDGGAVAPFNFGGIGQAFDPPPPSPNCVAVGVTSDSEAKFGHECPSCSKYWRSDPASICPYCGIRAERQHFLTKAQKAFIRHYCQRLQEIFSNPQDGDYVIKTNEIIEAVGKDVQKPAFYYTEQSQQKKFTCRECGWFNDILGTFAYCSGCGTRSDLQELEEQTIPRLRARINSGGPYEDCVKDAVAAFDSFTGRYVSQFTQRIPMTPARKVRLANRRFHNLKDVADQMKSIFDIDILASMKQEDVDFAVLMFHRRHIYEHKGGEADEKYIADSGDKSVKPKQALRETQESAHRLAGLVVKMATNLLRGFHEIFPPLNDRLRRPSP